MRCIDIDGPEFFIYYRGAILTPAEMEALTELWRPYRSIGKPEMTFCFFGDLSGFVRALIDS